MNIKLFKKALKTAVLSITFGITMSALALGIGVLFAKEYYSYGILASVVTVFLFAVFIMYFEYREEYKQLREEEARKYNQDFSRD